MFSYGRGKETVEGSFNSTSCEKRTLSRGKKSVWGYSTPCIGFSSVLLQLHSPCERPLQRCGGLPE